MRKFIIFLNKLIYLYLYFIIGACILSWVPNINPEYPLFHYIFKAAGFYIIPPFAGISLSPALVMIVCAFILTGLDKLYDKYFKKEEPKVVVLTQDEFLEKFGKPEGEVAERKDDEDGK